MARHDHRSACIRVITQDRANHLTRHRVDRFERLVQDQQPRSVDQRTSEPDLLGHAGRVLDNQGVPIVAKCERIEQLRRATSNLCRRQSPQKSHVVQQLRATEPVEQAQSVGQHPHERLRSSRISPDVMIKDARDASIWPEQTSRHRQCGGLAGTIRSDQSEHAAAAHLQIEMINGSL